MTPQSDEDVTLESLVGEHELTGVDFGHAVVTQYGYDENSETCTFVLDGVTYTVTEDPSDGYRSSMRSLVKGGTEVRNTFPTCRVLCSMQTAGEYGSVDDLLVMRDMVTGKDVLVIGTANTDDYYPCYRANFNPENMAVNQT